MSLFILAVARFAGRACLGVRAHLPVGLCLGVTCCANRRFGCLSLRIDQTGHGSCACRTGQSERQQQEDDGWNDNQPAPIHGAMHHHCFPVPVCLHRWEMLEDVAAYAFFGYVPFGIEPCLPARLIWVIRGRAGCLLAVAATLLIPAMLGDRGQTLRSCHARLGIHAGALFLVDGRRRDERQWLGGRLL